MDLILALQNAAKALGDTALKYWKANDLKDSVEYKKDESPVTLADKEINTEIIRILKSWFPNDGIYGEEESVKGISAVVWVVDPLDGTRPFSAGLPNYTAPAIARVERGVVTHAVVRCPAIGRTYVAERGKGAWLCEDEGISKQLRVSKNNSFKHTTVFGQCRKSSLFLAFDVARALTELGANNLSTGSIIDEAMYVARGGGAGAEPPVAALYHVDKPYDVAAPALIVEEAGGKVTDFYGNQIERYDGPVSGAIFTNGLLHDQLVELTKKCPRR